MMRFAPISLAVVAGVSMIACTSQPPVETSEAPGVKATAVAAKRTEAVLKVPGMT